MTKSPQIMPGERYLSKVSESQKSIYLRSNTANQAAGAFQHPKIGIKHPEVFKNIKKNLNAS